MNFFPSFKDSVSADAIVFKNLCKRYAVILSFQVANNVLAQFDSIITSKEKYAELHSVPNIKYLSSLLARNFLASSFREFSAGIFGVFLVVKKYSRSDV